MGGDGDDVIDSTLLTADAGFLFVPADRGADTLFGGPAAELSFSFTDDGLPSAVDDDADVFITAAGNDVIASGRLGAPNPDVIDLGPGDDIVEYAGTGAVAGGRLDGGPGQDLLAPSSLDPVDPPADPLPQGEAVFDARTGTATVGDDPYLTWTGIEQYSFFEVGPTHPLAFFGTVEPEQVSVGKGVQDIRLGAGDDLLQQGYGVLPAGSVRGGRGRDRFTMDVRGDAGLDLTGSAVNTWHGVVHSLAVHGFEDARAVGWSLRVRGTGGDNVLRVVTRGAALVEGLGGADRMRIHILGGGSVRPGQSRTVRGGRGDDVIWGSRLADVLRGGRGDDTAYGGRGQDVCDAEVRHDCEAR